MHHVHILYSLSSSSTAGNVVATFLVKLSIEAQILELSRERHRPGQTQLL